MLFRKKQKTPGVKDMTSHEYAILMLYLNKSIDNLHLEQRTNLHNDLIDHDLNVLLKAQKLISNDYKK